MELMRRNPVKFKLDVSDVTVVDRPSYLARSMIINPAGKRVEATSWQQRKGGSSASVGSEGCYFVLDVSGASVVERPSYLARSVIINHAGNRVESTSCQQRKGEIFYRLVVP